VVYRWPYDYSNPNYEEDFVPQNVPMKEGEEVLHHIIKKALYCKGLFILFDKKSYCLWIYLNYSVYF
jgi:hypothetical protein